MNWEQRIKRMALKQFLANLLPRSIKNKLHLYRNFKQLRAITKIECNSQALKNVQNVSLPSIMQRTSTDAHWDLAERRLLQYQIPEGTWGVNVGDRRAIYYLLSAFEPTSVLEIGTHIGASTLHIAQALSRLPDATLTSVDIIDMNSTIERPWLKYGVEYSPLEMITQLGFDRFVEFKAEQSLDFMGSTSQKFDFIFLDGDHSASTVYQEIPAALKLLNENGVILLHDYFPELQPLWSSGTVISGPNLAVQRLKSEGLKVVVLPLAELLWPTKLNSKMTSLALLLKVD